MNFVRSQKYSKAWVGQGVHMITPQWSVITKHSNRNEWTIFVYKTKEELDTMVDDFAYIWYNRIRPHSYNKGKTPSQASVDYILYIRVTILLD